MGQQGVMLNMREGGLINGTRTREMGGGVRVQERLALVQRRKASMSMAGKS